MAAVCYGYATGIGEGNKRLGLEIKTMLYPKLNTVQYQYFFKCIIKILVRGTCRKNVHKESLTG